MWMRHDSLQSLRRMHKMIDQIEVFNPQSASNVHEAEPKSQWRSHEFPWISPHKEISRPVPTRDKILWVRLNGMKLAIFPGSIQRAGIWRTHSASRRNRRLNSEGSSTRFPRSRGTTRQMIPTNSLNQRWYDYAGFFPQEAHGWGWKVTIHPEDLGKLSDKWWELPASRRAR